MSRTTTLDPVNPWVSKPSVLTLVTDAPGQEEAFARLREPVSYSQGLAFHSAVLASMFRTLEFNGGIGLAAPQVGWRAPLFVTGWGEVFVCPEYEPHPDPDYSGTVSSYEGCLSLPGRSFEVPRHFRIMLAGGRIYSGIQAFVIQHETDHLHGRLISDIGKLLPPEEKTRGQG